jgi:hypothetical protein
VSTAATPAAATGGMSTSATHAAAPATARGISVVC